MNTLASVLARLYDIDRKHALPFLFAASGLFLCLMNYEVVRAVSNAYLLQHSGAKDLPGIWLVSALAVACMVALYNRLVNILTFIQLLITTTSLSLLVTIVCWSLLRGEVKLAGAFFYVWKDIQVVLLVEQLWSLCDTLFPEQRAKGLYGLIQAAGCIGALAGNLCTSALPSLFGTVDSLLLAGLALVGMLILQLLIQPRLHMLNMGAKQAEILRDSCSTKGGLRLLLSSRYLMLIAGSLLLSQLATVLIDFEFSLSLEKTYAALDDKTRALSLIFACINGLAVLCQLAVIAPVIRRLGILAALLSYPLGLLLGCGLYLLRPVYTCIALLKIFNKSIDYSLYRAAKELLYIPLNYEMKYKAKATIDMFLYRAAKGATSGILLVGSWAFGTGPAAFSALLLPILGLWAIISVLLARDHASLKRA